MTKALLMETPIVRARATCCGRDRERMQRQLASMLVGQFNFDEYQPDHFRRREPMDDPERAELLEALWAIQLRFGPDTRLAELEIWYGLELKLLMRR